MKIYFAGTTGTEIRELTLQKLIRRRLLSYYYLDKGFAVKYGYELIKKRNARNIQKRKRSI